MPQPQPRQQFGLNEIQFMQQHIMFKQLQELQSQQQLQGLGDAGLQNYVNQLSMINKQASGGQFPLLIDGTPINDVPQLNMVGNMNLVQRGASQTVQGFPNDLVFSQAQSLAVCSMGLVPQQLGESLYGTPVASTRNNLNQYSPLQEASSSHDSNIVLAAGNNNLVEKATMQSSVFDNSFMSDQLNADQVCIPGKTFSSRQVLQEKKSYGQVSNQGFDRGMLPGNFQQVNTLQRNAAVQEYGERQDQAGWPGPFPVKTCKITSSQGLTSLDPLKKKILFNSKDNGREASFGGPTNMGGGGSGNLLDQTDYLSVLPSIQTGSWSALMQSAVAEASSSDAGLQEEWSGVSFQNLEHSGDNQPSSFVEVRKHHTDWVGKSLQSASSLTSKTELLFNNSGMSSTCPDFQQSSMQFTVKPREGICSDSSHESTHQSPKNASQCVDCDVQQNLLIEGSKPVQAFLPLCNNTWSGQTYEHSESVVCRPIISLHNGGSQCYNKLKGSMDGVQNQLNNIDAIPKTSTTEFAWQVDLETRLSRENCSQRENSIDSYHSNSSQHTATGLSVRENVWLHGSDSRPVTWGIQKSCYQVPQGSGHDQGCAEQFKFIRKVTNSEMDIEKGHSPEMQRNLKVSEELPTRSRAEFASGFYDGSTGFNALNVTPETRERRMETHSGHTHSTPFSGILQAETPDASAAQSYKNSSTSPCFGLKLALPSLCPPNHICLPDSQSSVEMGNSTVTSSSSLPHLRNQFQFQRLPAATVAGQTLQLILPDMAQKKPSISQDTSHLIRTNYSQHLRILDAMTFTQPSVSASTQVGFAMREPSLWTDVPAQSRQSDTEPPKVASILFTSLDTTNRSLDIVSGVPNETIACLQDYGCTREKPGKARSCQPISSEILDTVSPTGCLFHVQESAAKNILEENVVRSCPLITSSVQQGSDRAWPCDNQAPAISARDLDAFGGSLKQSSAIHQNHSLMHQLHSMKNVEIDSDDSILARSLVNSDPNSVPQLNSFSFGNNKILSFPSEVRGDFSVKALSQPVLKDALPEIVKFGQNDSQIHSVTTSVASPRTEHSQISMQMAPSWFEYYGTLKNGQLLPMYNASTGKNNAHRKPLENFQMPGFTGLVNLASANQVNSVSRTTATDSVAVKQFSPPSLLSADVTDPSPAVFRPKKRKIATFELLSWHKEFNQGSRKIQNIRTATLEWAQAANRLIEKVEDEAEMIKDLLPMLQPKKRLILSTQLMQQVFRASPILSASATSNCDSVVYFAARLALGDACSLTSDSYKSFDTCDMSCGKSKTSARIDDRDFSEIVEEFLHRSKRLEGDFLRLEKRTSILDMRVEYQELEKLSAINRLANFHSRGQAGAAETSSSGTAQTAMKTFPQRYVTVCPMPRTVPEGMIYLSL